LRPSKIVLITIDTLRADRLGCYGYGRRTTPVLDGLAAEGAMYPRAFTPATYTVPTHTSILTGLYPANHGLGFVQKAGKIDPDGTVMLQELLREVGYATGAFVSSIVLRKDFGLDWGFDVYDDRMTGTEANRDDQLIRDGRETNRVALSFMEENRGSDLFVWIHYFDVHGPYVQNRPDKGPFVPEDYGECPVMLDVVKDGMPGGIPEYQVLGAERGEDGTLTDCRRDLREYLAGYDNGVRFQDTVIGELMDGLRDMGMYDDTMVVVTSDHGEALGEDGVYFFHGLTVTPEQSRVPLIIKPHAGYEMPVPSETPVSTIDIMPTLLDMAGYDRGGLLLDGVSLYSQDPDRFVLTENEWQRAVSYKDYCLVVDKDVWYDGFTYYFDSRGLLKGPRLWELGSGKELPADPAGPAGPLFRFADEYGRASDRRDTRIKELEFTVVGLNALVRQKELDIAKLDSIIVHKDKVMEANERESKATIRALEGDLASVYASKSWRLTRPLRAVTGLLKGTKPKG